MSRGSRYNTLRKRVAPIAFLAALVLLGTRTCNSEIANVELRFDVGTHQAFVSALRVDVARQSDPGESLGHFEHNFKTAPESVRPHWKLQLDPGMYVLRIVLETAGGIVTETRTADVVDKAVIRISLVGAITRAKHQSPGE